MNLCRMGSSTSGSFSLVLTKCASLGGAGWRFGGTPGALLFGFLFFLIVFPHPLQEAISVLRVLDVLNPHIDSLCKYLALNLLVYNDAPG